MLCRVPVFCLVLPLTLLRAQYDSKQPASPELIMIGRVQRVVSEMLHDMPNFTCVETIERSQRVPTTKKFQLIDTIRLEVAFAEGRELYAWPGSARFEESDVTKLVGGLGAIGTGDFVLHANSIFLSGRAKFQYLGVEDLNGKPVHKLHYRIPMDSSTYWMKIAGAEGKVGYQGDVWHDKDNLDLLRVEMTVDEIPPQIPLRSAHKVIEYARMAIAERTFVLPVMIDLALMGMDGGESRNKTSFSGCKQYTGESRLVFEDPPPDTTKAPEAQVTVTLPKSLQVSTRLIETLDLKKAATGDAVNLEVTKDAMRDGVVVVPKGARLGARLDQVTCNDNPFAHCYVAILPLRIDFGNKTSAFAGELESPALERSIQSLFPHMRSGAYLPPLQIGMAAKGSAMLLLRGNKPRIASGYSMVWRTLEARGDQ